MVSPPSVDGVVLRRIGCHRQDLTIFT